MNRSYLEIGSELTPSSELAVGRSRARGITGFVTSAVLEIGRSLPGKEVVASAAALVAALAFGGSPAQASAEKSPSSASVGLADGQPPKASRAPLDQRNKEVGLKCSIVSIKQAKDSIVATGGCRLDGAVVPKKFLAWTQKATSKGYAGVCEGPGYSGTGKGNQFATPRKPAGVRENIHGGTMPPSLIAKFSLSATVKDQTARADRKQVFVNDNSYNLCGPPPELHNYPDEPINPTALTWETTPTLETPLLYNSSFGVVPGIISTKGNGNCKINELSSTVDAGYLLSDRYTISCESGVTGYIRATLLRAEGVTQCKTGVSEISYFPYPNDQYSGELKVGLAIISRDPNGMQYPDVLTPEPNANFFWTPFSVTGGGFEDPCDGQHPNWSINPSVGT